MYQDTVLRRTRGCICGAKYNTYEIEDGVWPTVRKWAVTGRTTAIKKRQALRQRNAEIVSRLTAGERGSDVASAYGLSSNMVSYLRKCAGLPPAKKRARRANPWAGL